MALLWEDNGTQLQYSCLENPMDGGAWKAVVHEVAKRWAWEKDFTFTFHFHALEKEMVTHSSVLAWRIPGTGEPGGLPSIGSHRVGHDWSDLATAAWHYSKCGGKISFSPNCELVPNSFRGSTEHSGKRQWYHNETSPLPLFQLTKTHSLTLGKQFCYLTLFSSKCDKRGDPYIFNKWIKFTHSYT